jgi:hypothetical protein
MTQHTRGAWRSLASVAAVAAAALAGSLLVSDPAQSALVAGDCADPFPVANLAAHDLVTGLTVSQGTAPDVFTGEVIGVLNDGIAPGLDMVMVRLSSTEIDRVGIWAGMSGSPVYADDGSGDLIGAVAYGLAYGPSPVAGVTPFEEMDAYLATAAPTVRVPAAAARRIARSTDVSAAQAAEGFAQLRMPLGVSGVSTARLENVKKRPYLSKSVRAMGGLAAAPAGPGVDAIVAGGNLALSAAYGEVTIAAVGTVTSVCDDRVVGFGHPATFGGKITAGLHPADALYIQEDPVYAGFKVANLGAPVGTITDDHQTGITGTLGAGPPTSEVTSSLVYGDRSGAGTSYVEMSRYLASTVYYQLIGNHDRVVDGSFPGSEDESWTIAGTGPDHAPFTLAMDDRFASTYDISDTASYQVADLAYYLSQLPGVKVDSVDVDGTVSDDASTYALKSLEYKSGGGWKSVANRGRVSAQAGKALQLRAVLEGDAGSVKVPLSVDIPKKLAGQRGVLSLEGGSEQNPRYWNAKNLKQFLKMAAADTRNDAVVATVFADAGKGSYEKTVSSDPADKVVEGGKWFRLFIS